MESHGPKGVAILTQLRVGLSKPNSHKFNYNFRDTVDPMCLINAGIEDTAQNAMHTRVTDVISLALLIVNLPNQTILQILLYGDKSFTHDQNRQILE